MHNSINQEQKHTQSRQHAQNRQAEPVHPRISQIYVQIVIEQ